MGNANPKKPGGGGGRDMVMESRHLLGVFLGVVVLCGVFFTLGYVMGRTQYDTSVRAAAANPSARPVLAPEKSAPADARPSSGAPAPSEWSFPAATSPVKTPETIRPLEPKPKETVASSPAPRPAAEKKALMKAPRIPRGAILLQVAALSRGGDALALAEALQQKKYPAFVQTPGGDNLYRVQVGPYADAQSAELAKRSLERDGFKAITKR